MTIAAAEEYKVILSVGDTTYFDYRGIKEKKEGYGPTGNGGNGLILHSALAIEPELGQTLGLLWQKLWNREHKPKPPKDETPEAKKQRQKSARIAARQRPFAQKESYKWVEAMSKMESEPIRFTQEINVPATANNKARKAKLAVRFCPVSLRTPYRFDNRDPLKVYAVYATEINCPEAETPLSWMLLTTEVVDDVNMAATILRWYTYRWRVEDYHKILKSGCQSERYRLAAVGMKTLLGFLSVIAVELLQVTYLHRTQPNAPAQENPQPPSD